VRKYLKTREDTVKCIVESLLDESAMELREELMKGGGIFLPYPPYPGEISLRFNMSRR